MATLDEILAPKKIADWDRFEHIPFGLSALNPHDLRLPVKLFTVGDHEFVRYHLGSKALNDAGAIVGMSPSDFCAPLTAIFALRHAKTGSPKAVFVFNDKRSPALLYMGTAPGADTPSESILKALRWIGAPPSQNIRNEIARTLDMSWSDRAGWSHVEPQYLMKFGFKRFSAGVSPPIFERFEVLTPVDPAIDKYLDHVDAWEAHCADQDYWEGAWDELHRQGLPDRPGFSSWAPESGPTRVKIIDASLDVEIAAMEAGFEERRRVMASVDEMAL